MPSGPNGKSKMPLRFLPFPKCFVIRSHFGPSACQIFLPLSGAEFKSATMVQLWSTPVDLLAKHPWLPKKLSLEPVWLEHDWYGDRFDDAEWMRRAQVIRKRGLVARLFFAS